MATLLHADMKVHILLFISRTRMLYYVLTDCYEKFEK